MIKIIIADDHPMLRSGIIQTINREPDMKVVNEYDSGEDLLASLNSSEVDLIILDINLPGKSGIEVLQEIRRLNSKIPVLIYSGYDEIRYGVRAIQAGANAFIPKDDKSTSIIEVLRKISTGKKFISQKLAELLADELTKDKNKLPHERLSEREFEVMRMIALGKSVSEIADILSLSINTVNTYRTRILEKMGLNNNTQIAIYALDNKLLD